MVKKKKIKYLFGRADYTSKCILGIFDTSTSKFPGGSDGEASACNVGDSGDMSSIPGSGRSPGGGNGNPLQYSCLENSKDREALWTTVHRITKSQTRLSN